MDSPRTDSPRTDSPSTHTLLPGVRLAQPDELAQLQTLEVAAGERFREIGMPDIADDEPDPLPVLEGFREDGRLWVVTDDRDRPVGYAIAREVDDSAYLQQVSVLVEHGRKGSGRRLVDQVERWGSESGLHAVTLCTFRDVPWNGPWYAKLGFEPVPDAELTPGLRHIREGEAARGLDLTARYIMRRPILSPMRH